MSHRLLAGLAIGVLLSSVSVAAVSAQTSSKTGPSSDAAALLAPWTGPYGGEVPFDKVKVAAFTPALEQGMRLKKA